jgi:hypothetical protein
MENSLELKVMAEVKKEVEVTIHLDDVIEKINELPIVSRYNYIAKMLNEISVDDLESLDSGHRTVISDYFKEQILRFFPVFKSKSGCLQGNGLTKHSFINQKDYEKLDKTMDDYAVEYHLKYNKTH